MMIQLRMSSTKMWSTRCHMIWSSTRKRSTMMQGTKTSMILRSSKERRCMSCLLFGMRIIWRIKPCLTLKLRRASRRWLRKRRKKVRYQRLCRNHRVQWKKEIAKKESKVALELFQSLNSCKQSKLWNTSCSKPSNPKSLKSSPSKMNSNQLEKASSKYNRSRLKIKTSFHPTRTQIISATPQMTQPLAKIHLPTPKFQTKAWAK